MTPGYLRGVAWGRTAIFLTLLGLAISRLALLGHELVGHAAIAVLLGGEVQEVRLFWFGGGYVAFSRAAPWSAAEEALVYLGGVLVELVTAALVLLVARRRDSGDALRVGLVAAGGLLVVHALYYLATGAHHGHGDGRLLHLRWPAWRDRLVWLLAAATLPAGFLAARSLAAELRTWVTEQRAGQAARFLGSALLCAAAVHGALTFGERAAVADRQYEALMQPETQRQIERAVASHAAARPAAAAGELARLARALAERRREFPLRAALGGGLALAALAGAASALRRPARAPRAAPGRRQLIGAGLVCLVALFLVASVDRLVP
jgi:hypothetical protein